MTVVPVARPGGDVAEGLVIEMQEGMKKIREQATFGNAAEREEVLTVYREGIAALKERLAD